MKQENPYYPFVTSRHENSISLLLAQDLKWDAFEEKGFLGNGYDWTRLIENLLKEKRPELLSTLEFDSEADMFCVVSEEEEPLLQVAEIVSAFYDDEELLKEHISKYAQYS